MLHGSKIVQPTSRFCHPRLRLGCQFTRDMHCPSFFLPRCVIYYFSEYLGRKCYFRSRLKNANVVFSARVCRKIVYAPRKKNWSAHSSCKLPPELKARVAIYTSCGLSKFFPPQVRNILFHHTLPESTTFVPGSKMRMWYFRPTYGEKQYMSNAQNCLQFRSLKEKKNAGTPLKKNFVVLYVIKYTRKLFNSQKWSCNMVLKNTKIWTKSSH